VGSASGPFFVRALFLELKTTVGIRRDEPGGICTRQVALLILSADMPVATARRCRGAGRWQQAN
jgi:hypothetical protein